VLTSAITGDGIEQLFRKIAEQYKPKLRQMRSEEERKSKIVVKKKEAV
jgi:putative protein kinase ArgK-like GTPase of G3E family